RGVDQRRFHQPRRHHTVFNTDGAGSPARAAGDRPGARARRSVPAGAITMAHPSGRRRTMNPSQLSGIFDRKLAVLAVVIALWSPPSAVARITGFEITSSQPYGAFASGEY